jgi:hypothetical protein
MDLSVRRLMRVLPVLQPGREFGRHFPRSRSVLDRLVHDKFSEWLQLARQAGSLKANGSFSLSSHGGESCRRLPDAVRLTSRLG